MDLITVTLRGRLDDFKPAQRRVAQIILADPRQASAKSISDLAEQAGTSQATVVRLAHELGLSGYPELRLALATEQGMRQQADVPAGDIAEGDDLASVVAKIAYIDVQAVRDTTDIVDIAALEAVITALQHAHRIDVYGVGASAIVGADLVQKLTRIGRMAVAYGDAHLGLTSAALLTPGDVAIAISHSGHTADTLDMLRQAGVRGAKTIAVTNSPNSPLAKLADHTLLTAARESLFRSGATASRLAQLVVVDFMFVGLAQRTFHDSQAALELTRSAIMERRPTS